MGCVKGISDGNILAELNACVSEMQAMKRGQANNTGTIIPL